MQTPNLTQCAHSYVHDRQGSLHVLECVRCGHKAVIPADEQPSAQHVK